MQYLPAMLPLFDLRYIFGAFITHQLVPSKVGMQPKL